MKLALCNRCGSIFNLTQEPKLCECAETMAWYKADGIGYSITGPGIIFGIDNFSMYCAKKKLAEDGIGSWIRCWMFPTPDDIEKVNMKAGQIIRNYMKCLTGVGLKPRPMWCVRIGAWLIGAKYKHVRRED